jgi:hypothetical protein
VDSVYKSENGILTAGLALSVIRRFITVLTTASLSINNPIIVIVDKWLQYSSAIPLVV